MKVISSNRADFELTEIYHYIALDSPFYASKTLNNIYSLIFLLTTFPYIGRYVPEYQNKLYRELIYKHYRIIYKLTNNIIKIQTVIHTSRDFYSYFSKSNF